MFSKVVVLLAIFAAAVNGQSSEVTGTSTATSATTSSTAGISACIFGCVGPAAAQNGCGSFTNITCVCGSAQFQADAGKCIQDNCPNDYQASLGLQQAQCANAGVTPTGSATPNPVSFSSAGASSTASRAASSSSGGAAPASTSKAAGSIVEASVVGVLGAVLAGVLAL